MQILNIVITLLFQIGSLANYYLLEKEEHPHRSKRAAHLHTRALEGDDRVRHIITYLWFMKMNTGMGRVEKFVLTLSTSANNKW